MRGIFLMLVSMALFAVEDMFLKMASASLPTGQIIFVAGFLGAPVFAVMAWLQGARILTRFALHPAGLLRALGEVVGTFGYILALATVPLSTISAVLQAMPLAVTMGAALFMQEKVGWRRWRAVAFGGVVRVILRGVGGFLPRALWGLLTVGGFPLRDLAARAIPRACSD